MSNYINHGDRSANHDLESKVLSLRVTELQSLLGAFALNKIGKKQELQSRALELLRLHTGTRSVRQKVEELYADRFDRANIESDLPTTNQYQGNTYGGNNRVLRPSTRSTHARYSQDSNNHGRVEEPQPPPQPPQQRSIQQMYASMPIINQNRDLGLGLLSPVIGLASPTPETIQFKELPFYELKATLKDPILLRPPVAMKFNEQTFTYQLTAEQANMVSMSRKISEPYVDYENQIQMRFAIIVAGQDYVDDQFPPGIIVKVNGKLAQLPNPIPTNKPGVEPKRPSRPVDVTSLSRLSPDNQNQVTITWNSSDGTRIFVVGVFLVRKLTTETLVTRLRARAIQPSETTRNLVRVKLNCDDDDDICLSSLSASLQCPLGKMRMQIPSRATTCNHIQCFDANLYISMNEKKPTWNCPVCDQPAIYKHLIIDELFQRIIEATSSDTKDVEFGSDGEWKAITKNPQANKRPIAPDDSADIIDEPPSETITEEDSDDENEAPATKKSKPDVECITLDSDSDSDSDNNLEDGGRGANLELVPEEPEEVETEANDSDTSNDSVQLVEETINPQIQQAQHHSTTTTTTSGHRKETGGGAYGSVSGVGFVGGTGLGRVPPIPSANSRLTAPTTTNHYDSSTSNSNHNHNHGHSALQSHNAMNQLPILDDMELFPTVSSQYPAWSASSSPSNQYSSTPMGTPAAMSPLDPWANLNSHYNSSSNLASNNNLSISAAPRPTNSYSPHSPYSNMATATTSNNTLSHSHSLTGHSLMSATSNMSMEAVDRTSEWIRNSFFHNPLLHPEVPRPSSGSSRHHDHHR